LGVPGKDNVYGSGRVDAYAALNELIGPPVQFQLQVLASTEAWQYPALPPVNLTVEVSVSYLQNGVLVAENRTTPFSIKADQGSATTLTARSIPMGYGWVEWDNYGFGRTKAVTMEVRMDGDRTAVAYVKEAATNMTQVSLTIHAHHDAYQYPEEPVAELNATLEMTYQTNGTWKMQEPQTMGPEAFTLHVDRDSSVKLEVTQIPEPYLWHEWDEYGKGRGPSLGITILMDKDKTAVAYFTPKTAHGGDFTITANPLTQYFIPGQTVNYTLKITAYDGFEDNVSLTILTLPPSTDATLIPATIRPNGTSTLIVMTTPNTPLTPNILVVNASGGGKSHTVQLTLSPAQIPGFDQTTITIGVLLGALLLIKGRQVSTGSPARSLRRKFQ